MIETLIIDNDKTRLNIPLIYDFLTNESSWAKGITLSTVEKSIKHSLCFGGYINSEQVAFCRVITDYSTFANLVDVIVFPDHRGKGIAKRLMKKVIEHPELVGIRHFTLATSDAHSLYQQFGFKPLEKPEIFMERHNKDIYKK